MLLNHFNTGWVTFDDVSLTRVGQETVIKRSSYGIAGQIAAIRVSGDPVSGNDGISYFYNDHLGSNTALRKPDGSRVSTYYLPFGGYRPGSAPTQTITDRDFTGQRENMELGLLYYQARFYVPAIGRFASADTIVPDPTNPQQFNRYTYVLNNPIVLVDPTGHFSESAIYGYLYAYECNLSHECASQLFHTWQNDEEWWTMLLEAEDGDILFGSFSAGPNKGVVHFRFSGSGRDVLTGVTYSDAKGNHVSNSFWGIDLRDIRSGATSKLYHGSPLSFNWGGLLRYPTQGEMPLLPYLRGSTSSATMLF